MVTIVYRGAMGVGAIDAAESQCGAERWNDS